jgi:hypothetical protein
MYKCGWNGCEKAYGTLNHLNAHVTMQLHGQKRTPEGMLTALSLSVAVMNVAPSHTLTLRGVGYFWSGHFHLLIGIDFKPKKCLARWSSNISVGYFLLAFGLVQSWIWDTFIQSGAITGPSKLLRLFV